jgi:hypothetical protein
MTSKPDTKILSQGLGTLILTILTVMLLSNPRPSFPILDGVNQIIHQLGHVLFGSFDQFTGIIGGPLFQILVPAVIATGIWFWKKRTTFGFALFWLGESMINVSIYIKDARTMLLLPAHGEMRDWYLILGQMNMLSSDLTLGSWVYIIAVLICLAGVGQAIYFFLKNSKQLSRQNTVK